MNKISTPREDFRNAVNDAIHELENILELYNPLEILANISKHIATFSLQDHFESEDMLWYPLIEYLMSLALTKPIPASPTETNKDTIEVILNLWMQLKNNFFSYYGSEYVSEKGKPEAEIRFKLILDYFSIREKAYLPHTETTFLELFRPHKDHLVNALGFSADDFNDFIHYAEKEITSALQKELDAFSALKELHTCFCEWKENQEIVKEDSDGLMKRFIEENSDLQSHKDHASQLSKLKSYDGLEIQPQCELHKRILNAISCSFGDNVVFLNPQKWRGWPTNDTIISKRPIIKYEEDYYLFHFTMLASNRVEIMESLLEQYSPDYYQDRYLPSRDRYVEDTTLSLLQNILPDSSIYANLYYYVIEDGTKKRVELDGLTLYDDCLLLIEAKAAMLPFSAKRGSIKGLESKVSEILKKGHSQAIRAMEYIQSSPTVTFYDEKDVVVVSVEKDMYQHQYLILVTLEPLFVLTSHLSSVEKLGLLSGEKWPWAVYINDLRVIADIIDHPSVFLHYLNRRIELNNHPAAETYDELDYLLHYLRTGLYFSQDVLKQYDSIIIVPSTVELDEYYNGITKTKPYMKMDSTFETLINCLENERPPHFLSTCFHLLDCDDDTRCAISEGIRICEQRFSADRKPKSVAFRIDGTGLLLGCMDDIDHLDIVAKDWATRWLNTMNVTHVTVLIWGPPIDSSAIRLFEFYRNESPSTSSSK